MKKFLSFLVIVILITSCQSGGKGDQNRKNSGDEKSSQITGNQPSVDIDLEDIRERDTLRAIMTYSSTSYFLYRGQPMGYEYELLKRLADHLDLELEVIIADDMDKMFAMLNSGEGDIIAHGMTITQERKDRVNFTLNHTITHQALVQRKPDNWRKMKLHNIDKMLINDAIELTGKPVHVRENSSYYQRLKNLEEEIGGNIDIKKVSGELSTEDLIRKVANKEIKYTVADYNIASINKTYYPILDIDVAVSFSQKIAWAVRKNSPELLKEINSWIAAMKQKTAYYVIYNKYFKNKKAYKRRVRSDLYSMESGKISKYDPIVKQYSDSIGWDWRLLSSMIYQESGFDPNAKSWVGAKGLLQMMPRTAEELGYSSLSRPKTSIEAGVKYIDKLENSWPEIPDKRERQKFVMASYNVGPNHVADARRLTKKYGGNPDKWHGEVDEYLLKLASKKYYTEDVVRYGYCRGSEPYKYVKEIFERYEHYKKFTGEKLD